MFSFITTKLLAYVCVGLFAALVITGGFAGCEHHNANAARAERDAVKASLGTALDANTSNQTTIEAQNRALNAWMKLGQSPGEVRQLLADAKHAIDESTAELVAMLSTVEKERANPECGALLGANLEHACPGIAHGLRSAASGHQDGAGRDPGSSRQGAPSGAHGGLRATLPLPEH